jgi:radical SAM protein with 4Fe4S-binding SPASM domain
MLDLINIEECPAHEKNKSKDLIDALGAVANLVESEDPIMLEEEGDWFPAWGGMHACFGNIFHEPDLTRMLKTSRARQDFVERPKRLVEDEDCLSCHYPSICHGGCPVRTYSARGTVMTKDPHCEVYKVVFARAETHARGVLRKRLAINPNPSATTPHRAISG